MPTGVYSSSEDGDSDREAFSADEDEDESDPAVQKVALPPRCNILSSNCHPTVICLHTCVICDDFGGVKLKFFSFTLQ